jgi:hypothetical protein
VTDLAQEAFFGQEHVNRIVEDTLRDYADSDVILPLDVATALAEAKGCTPRHIYRLRAAMGRSEPDQIAPRDTKGWTFLDYLTHDGPESFFFDDLALTLLYMVGGNLKEFYRQVEAGGYTMPSYQTLWLRAMNLDPLVRDGARNGLKNRHSKALYLRYDPDSCNALWEVDECILNIEVRYGKKVVRPHMLAFIDGKSRYITSVIFVPHGVTAKDFIACLAAGMDVWEDEDGVEFGGVPSTIVFDNAQAFRGNVSSAVLATLPTYARPAPAYSPEGKGKIEAVNDTLETKIVVGVPGWCSPSERLDGTDAMGLGDEHLLDWDDFLARAFQAVSSYNHEVHSATGRTPASIYAGSGANARRLAPADLAALLLVPSYKNGERIVQPDGIHHDKMFWIEACLAPHVGNVSKRDVEVREFHHLQDKIAVFWKGEFVGFAINGSVLTKAERVEILNGRRATRAMVTQLTKATRHALRRRSTEIKAGADCGALGAVVLTHPDTEQRAKRVGGPETTEMAVDQKATDSDDADETGATRPGRRPATRRSAKGAKEGTVPAASENGKLDLAEAALSQRKAGTTQKQPQARSKGKRS